ncbi:MAG: MFS transporter [Flavisolibacter sp.]
MRLQNLSPLLYKEFRYFIGMRFFYTMALRMIGTVVAYQLFHLTRTSFSIGLLGMSEFMPVFFLALYAGHVIDKSDKRTLLLKGILCYGACTMALIFVTIPSVERLLSVHALAISFYIIIFFTGVVRAFAGPASSAIIAQLIPREYLPLASNISSTSWLAASIIGHASAGFFIAWFGVNYTFYIIFAYVLIGAFFISRIRNKEVMNIRSDIKTWESVKEGLRFVVRQKVLLSAMSLDLFAVLFGGAVALIPEFADRILHVGPIGFGWLNASIDIGSLLIIFSITLRPFKHRQGLVQLLVIAGFGICMMAFAVSRSFWLSFFILFVAGILDGINVVIRANILQLITPDDMRGRISSVNSMFVNSSNELGQFESGLAAKLMGTVPSVLFGGGMTILIVIFTWFKAPGLRKFEY